MSPDTQISVVIPTFNRFTMVKRAVSQVMDDSRVGEIVICDDASTDGSYEKFQDWVKDEKKLRLYRNEKNLDCYGNKAQALRHATTEWSILFDSDNLLGKDYVDCLYRIPQWDMNACYLPVFAMPSFDYRQFAGKTVKANNVRQFMDNPDFRCALNTANYFVRRANYLGAWDPNVVPHTADSIYMNYRLLAAGKSLVFVPGLQYEHLVHVNSHYKLNHHKTGNFAVTVEKKLRALR